MKRRSFTQEFKQRAVLLVLNEEMPVKTVSKKLEVRLFVTPQLKRCTWIFKIDINIVLITFQLENSFPQSNVIDF
ncbi:transposase [Enterococcus raffinosus]|nr:transposase [Enterococcus raffinosus]